MVGRAAERRSRMKQTAKDAILARIRKALANAPEPPPVPHDFLERDERDRSAILEELIDRLVDYKALVTSTDDTSLPQAIVDACQQHGIARLVVPPDLPDAWLPADVTVLR